MNPLVALLIILGVLSVGLVAWAITRRWGEIASEGSNKSTSASSGSWEDRVNAVWRNVALEVGAEFQFRKGREHHSNVREAKIVRKTEAWTLELQYMAVEEPGYDLLESEFHTTTTVTGYPNRRIGLMGYPRMKVFFQEGSERKSPGLNRIFNWRGDNWRLPIDDHGRLVELFNQYETMLAKYEASLGSPGVQELLNYAHEYDKKGLLTQGEYWGERFEHRGELYPDTWPEAYKRHLLGEAKEFCSQMTDLDVEARVLEEDPALDSEEWFAWIEITGGPIRWVAVDEDPETGFHRWLIPDNRIGPDFPIIDVFRPQWKSISTRKIKDGWRVGDHSNRSPYFSQQVSYYLTRDLAAGPPIMRSEVDWWVGVVSIPARGCWAIIDVNDDTEWTRSHLDYYEALAKSLLAMPLPTKG